MPRPSRNAPIDLSATHDLSVGLIDRLSCPPDKEQVFLRARSVDGLRVRCTARGAKSWVYEAKVQGRTFRRTLAPVAVLSIAQAEQQARALALTVKNDRQDPRELERQQAASAARAAEEARQRAEQESKAEAARAVTVREAWDAYLTERRPHWRERTFADHLKMTVQAGTPHARLVGATRKAGPLVPLMPLRLADLTPDAVRQWAEREAPERAARVRLALRLLKAFLRWAAQEPAYKGLADPEAASSKKARELAGKPARRDDVLQREQLAAWFMHVRAITNPTISAYLQCLLLTGARREELLRLRWDDVNFQWKGLRIADKVHDEGREVPLTPYVEQLLRGLHRRNEWVFASVRTLELDEHNSARRARYHARKGQTAPRGDAAEASASGHISDPSQAHRRACHAAGLEGLTLHGLRRSFASLCEWLDIPGGISAQIQGHAPQGVREQNYIRRPLDLLRVHHRRIEAWMLEQAGMPLPAETAAPAERALRAVHTARPRVAPSA